jgi:hypothetical protein
MSADDFDIKLFDQTLQKIYDRESKLSTLITLFTILAIIISLMGVFGLVMFEAEGRRKEIGVRRVNGATVEGDPQDDQFQVHLHSLLLLRGGCPVELDDHEALPPDLCLSDKPAALGIRSCFARSACGDHRCRDFGVPARSDVKSR